MSAKMSCRIRSATRRAQAKGKSSDRADRILSRTVTSSMGTGGYRYCTDPESTAKWSSGRPPRFVAWRREG